MTDILYKLIKQPIPLTAVELSRLSLSEMNQAIDSQDQDHKRRRSVDNSSRMLRRAIRQLPLQY